jgi:hypothetical protein
VRTGRTIGAAVAALAAALACALPASALARRGDWVSYNIKPADGAVVTDASKGLAIEFTCPRYHSDEIDSILMAPTEGYHVVLSTRPDTTIDGLLAQPGTVDQRDAVLLERKQNQPADQLHCTAAEDDAGLGLLPREPGTYYWQVYRDCVTYLCGLGGREVFDIFRVTVRRTVCTVTRAELRKARADLGAARAALRRRRTSGRRARVARLGDRVSTLDQRLRVVYGCRR